jgi:hypothetical protein
MLIVERLTPMCSASLDGVIGRVVSRWSRILAWLDIVILAT